MFLFASENKIISIYPTFLQLPLNTFGNKNWLTPLSPAPPVAKEFSSGALFTVNAFHLTKVGGHKWGKKWAGGGLSFDLSRRVSILVSYLFEFSLQKISISKHVGVDRLRHG